jgi:nucleoside-diphosphate-sugar epimerase
MADNIGLTQKLLSIPHRKFIFISTSDVYPKVNVKCHESDEFLLESVSGLYGISKLMAEAVVKNTTPNHLILRPTALLGRDARPNSLYKILFVDKPAITLSHASTFNYVLHEDVLDFIRIAISEDITGTYNVASSSNICLGDVASEFKLQPEFGNFTYQSPQIDNTQIVKKCQIFSKSSLDNIRRFYSLMEATREC